ncbi:MAG TPA: kelch repeat-containing protein [Solirubrobacteraceae bacterium]|nr:kelch repeat-containing protein [Solirubrobacteraceae bacterium]
MLLLTDGRVMCHAYNTADWYALAPDTASDYANGTWTQLASMPSNVPARQHGPLNAPLYFVSAVLKDGRVLVAGGEWNAGESADILAAEIYDSVANTWTSLPTPEGWANIGDAPSCVLPDGRVLIGDIKSTKTALFDPATSTWTAGPDKHDQSAEETWTLLPDGSVLSVEVYGHPNAERYIDSANPEWKASGSIPAGHELVDVAMSEIGPAILMTNGNVFAIGATGHTALYSPPAAANEEGTWAAGPDFPEDPGNKMPGAVDAPACLLPNGNVLCVVGHEVETGLEKGYAGEPSRFFEYDGASLNEVTPPESAKDLFTFSCRLLLLPTGEALFSACTSQLYVYKPDGSARQSWRPTIVSAPSEITPGGTYEIRGTQLNGLSQANSYGDDAQMATNYPLARVRDDATGRISYLRTHDHSTMGVATGSAVVSTQVSVPNLPAGAGRLSLISNGIESTSMPITVLAAPLRT